MYVIITVKYIDIIINNLIVLFIHTIKEKNPFGFNLLVNRKADWE